MVNSYSITIKNESGVQRKYALFNKEPKVTGNVQGRIWSNVFATKSVPPNQKIVFKLTNKYFAVVGSSEGNPGDAVEMTVAGDREVNLGAKTSTGKIIPGSTLEVIVDDDAPQFSTNALPDTSLTNAFEIRTGDFSSAKAKKGK